MKSKYCYLHCKKGGNKKPKIKTFKMNKNAPEFVPKAISQPTPRLKPKPKGKTLSKSNTKPQLKPKLKPKSKGKSQPKASSLPIPIIKSKKKSIKDCVNYYYTCKRSKYGDVYKKRCNLQFHPQYNFELGKQADKCVIQRLQHRQCRTQLGNPPTPKHDFAIRKIQNNAQECLNILKVQTNPQQKTFVYKR